MIRYWKEDTETEIGIPFDLEKHDKEISNKWLEKVKQAREDIENLTPWDEGTVEMYEVLEIIDKLIAESEDKDGSTMYSIRASVDNQTEVECNTV